MCWVRDVERDSSALVAYRTFVLEEVRELFTLVVLLNVRLLSHM
jgi:hypothetical protein